jgi:arylsulfatase A-like enzyme
LVVTLVFSAGAILARGQEAATARKAPPSFLFVIADDWGFPHAGAYGDTVVRTPNFDRLAREGALFRNAFCASPSCTPSRGAILTGQAIHRLGPAGNLHSFLPDSYTTYPDRLERSGYTIGLKGKGWAPGVLENTNRTRNPAGPAFPDFETFLKTVPDGKPFAFWYGSQDPHRVYEPGSGAASGLDPNQVTVPPWWPDTPEVRNDILDYYREVELFDTQVGALLAALEKSGRADSTLVIVTSDNGCPFPRGKANLYDAGTHEPMAARWPGHIKPGTVIDGFVVLADIAPTALEIAGLPIDPAMTGRSLVPLLEGKAQEGRDAAFFGRERHANVRKGDLSYPSRAIRTADFLFIENLRPDRWPAGDPEKYKSVGPYGDIDGGPTKGLMMARRDDPAVRPLFESSFGKRPAEELFDLKADPYQLHNVADDPAYASRKADLKKRLGAFLSATGDPVSAGAGREVFDDYEYFGERPAARPGVTKKGAARKATPRTKTAAAPPGR